MGIGRSLRKFADRARGKVRPEQAESGIDKAADKFDEATGGKYASKADKVREKGKNAAKKYLRDEQ